MTLYQKAAILILIVKMIVMFVLSDIVYGLENAFNVNHHKLIAKDVIQSNLKPVYHVYLDFIWIRHHPVLLALQNVNNVTRPKDVHHVNQDTF